MPAFLPAAMAVVLSVSTSRSSAFTRRSFVGLAGCAAGAASSAPAHAAALRSPEPAWKPDGDPDDPASYFAQLRAGRDEMQRLIRDWTKITKADGDTDFDGDAVRRVIGTVGVSSPLLAIEKTLTKVRKGVLADPKYEYVDVEELVELSQDVVQGLRDTDLLAYSTIFADPSGNAGVPDQNSKAYLEKTRKALLKTMAEYDKLLKVLHI